MIFGETIDFTPVLMWAAVFAQVFGFYVAFKPNRYVAKERFVPTSGPVWES